MSPDRRALQRLQRAAGNAAVSRLVAQRYTAPVKPSPAQAPGFRGVKADVAAKKQHLAQHRPAGTESKASQAAAVAPPDDKEAQGKAANAEKMNAAKPGEFDKNAFVEAVNKAIDAQAPKNLDEADKFSKSGKADKIKAEVDGKVTDGKESSAKDIDTATKAPPDTSAAKDKPVTPLTPDQPPGNPGAPSAAAAIPEKQPASVTDFSEGPAQNDKAMADAEVTEDQLAKGNEPEFNEALSAKKTAEADSAKAPAKGRSAENQQLNTAKAGAAASGAAAMSALTATRTQAGQKVDGGKGETKSKDEKKRAEVTAKLQKVYDGTKKDVEATLDGLDKKVDTAFTTGEKAARDAFTADHERRMKKYKDKRYSGWRGKARWVKDKFAGLPDEANNLYQEARKLYVSQMQTVISSVADIIGTELGKAKARIAKGRKELKAEVDKLPADLRQFGEEAAKDFADKFDDLESTVNEKSEQLVQDLASKYTAALNKIDEEIKKLQEANKGLIDKAKDAIVGAIKTINDLKNLLLGILAKAAGAIMKIIKDPIGFLGNLVSAVGAGLNLFMTNIVDHLKTGVVSWLLGTAVKAGLELPQKFDMKGIIQLIGSLLGLTWANIRARVTRKGVPDQAMTAVESSVPVAKNIANEGPAGAVKEIQEEAGDLKSTILEKLTSYLIPTVIIAGITWILSLLNPASAFVRAVKGIIDIVTFIVNQGAQIVEFVNSVLDAVVAIANGDKAGVPKMVETALSASVPLLIGFLASLLGIGSLAAKVKSVFHAVARPVNRAIDKIVNFIAKKGKALWNKLKKPKKDDKGTKSSAQGKQDDKVRNIDIPTTIGQERHTLRAHVTRTKLSILMASGNFEEVNKKVELLHEVSEWMKKSPDSGRRQTGEQLDESIGEVNRAAQQLISKYASTPDSPSRDRMVTSGLHDLSEMIHEIGVRFRLHGFDFRRPEHNLVPSAVDQYGRALAYSGDPLSLESKNKGSASSGVYTPGIDIDGVGPLQRGHLVADLLGGPGNDRRNLSTITTATNTAMKKPERAVADFIYKGDISNQVTYSVSIEHAHNDATGYQSWLDSEFPASRADAGERLFQTTSTHRPSASEINTIIGVRSLTPADHERILLGLAHYLISSRVLFSITSNPGPSNTIPTPSGSPISNSIPPP
ncbi:DNA/RNA non-specific endonuclease [Streptomyces sp. NPDC006976]|uniref:DNA/RNA non-specific endonuclease n=1 Tax=Streptomyces sp. NPDC006976 TaxID=3154311 RepID=UPI0033DE8884